MGITQEQNPQSSEVQLGQENDGFKEEEVNFSMSDEEIKGVMETIAATGKFWHEWEELKSILSFRLKQVLAEYPESQVENDSGSVSDSLPGDSYPETARRLDEALSSFIEGPPFTLQRLCEILLAPRTLYPKLSKLALALEKNLLVTSTLMRSTEPLSADMLKAEPKSTNKDVEMADANVEVDGSIDDVEKAADIPTYQGESNSVEDRA